jgi:LysM repeat protein
MRSLLVMLSNRPIGAALLGIALLGLAACGDGDGGAAVSTVPIQPSSYVVREAVTTTTAPTVPEPDAEGRSAAEQQYVVSSDEDVPYNIAIKFDVPLDELRNYNGWDEDFGGFPGRGGIVRIPPGAKFIDPSATTTTAAGDTAEDDGDEEETAATGSGDRCSPTYVIESGDAPLVVTRKFDITLDQLNAVNQNTPNWPNFYTGNTINLPPPADCPGAVTATTSG